MLFTQFQYALFFVPVFALHWAMPVRFRWLVLLTASILFYASWSLSFFPALFFVTMCSYAAGRIIRLMPVGARGRRVVLALGVLASLAPLLFFKYWNFVVQTAAQAFSTSADSFLVHFVVPVGISFFTFKAVGYLVDVFRETIPVEKNVARFFLFISFFPAIVSGPIDRAGTLLPQLSSPRPFEYGRARSGVMLLAWGLFQKLIVADPFSVLVNQCWSDPLGGSCGAFALAVLCYAVQIYCDFAGYSNMAIGSAKLLGVDLAENFRNPYFATSVQDFWRRWHISLSTWFRDYVYIPLGGNRCSWMRHKFNLFATFVASGLWHGAGGTFLAWGAIHGIVIAFEAAVFPKRKRGQSANKPPSWIMLPVTFVTVCVAWVFFRSESCADAILVLRKLLGAVLLPQQAFRDAIVFARFEWQDVLRLLAPLLLLFARDLIIEKKWHESIRLPAAVRWVGYLVFIAFCIGHHLTWGVSSESFIYFKF